MMRAEIASTASAGESSEPSQAVASCGKIGHASAYLLEPGFVHMRVEETSSPWVAADEHIALATTLLPDSAKTAGNKMEGETKLA